MKLLLDTCTFLWLILDAAELSEPAKAAFKDKGAEVYLSAASCWEISIKYQIKRLALPSIPDTFVPLYRNKLKIESLPIEERDALYVHRLPPIHQDPFDRMLISQASLRAMVVLTPDPQISQYGVQTLW